MIGEYKRVPDSSGIKSSARHAKAKPRGPGVIMPAAAMKSGTCLRLRSPDCPGANLAIFHTVQFWTTDPLTTKGLPTMKVNVGAIDRIARIVAGLALIGLAVAGTIGTWGYIGIVVLLTGLMRVCPAYSVLGVNTCSTGKG